MRTYVSNILNNAPAHLVTIKHIPSVSNPLLSLHQEYDMRSGANDDLALVEVDGSGMVRFADVVAERGMERAVRSVTRCYWMSDCEIREYHTRTERPAEVDCTDCLEVAHA